MHRLIQDSIHMFIFATVCLMRYPAIRNIHPIHLALGDESLGSLAYNDISWLQLNPETPALLHAIATHHPTHSRHGVMSHSHSIVAEHAIVDQQGHALLSNILGTRG